MIPGFKCRAEGDFILVSLSRRSVLISLHKLKRLTGFLNPLNTKDRICLLGCHSKNYLPLPSFTFRYLPATFRSRKALPSRGKGEMITLFLAHGSTSSSRLQISVAAPSLITAALASFQPNITDPLILWKESSTDEGGFALGTPHRHFWAAPEK